MRPVQLALTCASLFMLLARPAASQQGRTVLGQIRDALTGQPVGRGEAVIPGTPVRDSLRANGVFVLRAAPARFRVVVTAPNYQPDTTDVPAGPAILVIRLRPAPVQLGAVTATGAGAAPAANTTFESVQELLRAAPGVDVQQNSGTPGTSLQVRLEGVTTILGDMRPLWVLDGVIVSDDALPSGITTVTGGLHADTPSRILDLNPNDVARIEVLQGAAATARYGSRGANGVVVITTKRG
jgi:TonB-dependent starch-binding outer membrane protein SusC